MENFKEIAEKCLSGELSGTFVTAFDNNWHSSYLQRYTVLGNEIPGQYILGPGVIYNEIGQCINNEKIKIIDFIPDTMENFKEIAEKCLAGELSGTFVLHNGDKRHVSKENQTIRKDHLDPYSPYIIGNRKYSRCGVILPISNNENPYDIVDFIPDNMQEQIKIDIPEGMKAVQETIDGEIRIKFVKKELTYEDICNTLDPTLQIHNFSCPVTNNENFNFVKKVEVLRKLTNIRNYFGKPDKKNSDSGWVICINGTVYRAIVEQNTRVPVFAEKEHAEQAIKMLGDELKYLFEPW